MKLTKFANIIILGIVVAVAGTACKKRPTPVTLIPGSRAGGVQVPGPGTPLGGQRAGTLNGAEAFGRTTPDGSNGANGARRNIGEEGIGYPGGPGHEGWIGNTEVLRQYTVLFDFDSSAIRSSEASKINSVADYLKSHGVNAVRVEGHCDERGTEEYNRALGERRALAVREELVRAGLDPTRADTVSFGKDRPADPGHDEQAWRQNRRAEFILLAPPTAAP